MIYNGMKFYFSDEVFDVEVAVKRNGYDKLYSIYTNSGDEVGTYTYLHDVITILGPDRTFNILTSCAIMLGASKEQIQDAMRSQI